MPTENRQITFSGNELREAVKAYRRVAPDKIPAGTLSLCQPIKTGIALECSTEGGDFAVRGTVNAAVATEILIRYCLENNIVIPRKGKKSFSVAGDNATLIIYLASVGIEP